MSRARELRHDRRRLDDVATNLGAVAGSVESRSARTCLSRARAYLRAAQAEIDQAMRCGVDPVVLHRGRYERPARPDQGFRPHGRMQ